MTQPMRASLVAWAIGVLTRSPKCQALTQWVWVALVLSLLSAMTWESHSPQAARPKVRSGVDPDVCIDTSLFITGIWADQGNWDVTVAGNLALAARLRGGLDVYDISAPGAPVFRDNFPSAGSVLDVAVSGNLAYLAEWDFQVADRGVIVVSLTNPANLQQVGGNTIPTSPYDVAITDSLLFVCDGTVPGKLWIMSLANPVAPSVIGSYQTPHHAKSVFVVDTLAYLALAQDGMAIVNVSNPALPVLVGSLPGLTSAYDIYVVDTVAYVANVTYGLALVDVSNPTSPALLSTYDTPGSANDVEVVDGFAHVADIDGGYIILDVSDPLNPSLVEAVASVDRMLGLTVRSPYTFGADDAAFSVYVFQGQGVCGDLAVGPCEACEDGNLVRGDGCSECNLDPLAQLCPLVWLNTPGNAWGLATRDTLLFLADRNAGLQIYNVRYPSAPALLGGVNTPGEAFRVAVSGDLAAVADERYGLQLIDVSQPTLPVTVGSYGPAEFAHDVTLEDTLAFVSGWDSLRVISIANPSLPSQVGSAASPGPGYGLRLQGQKLYVASGTAGLHTFDVSDPAHPVLLRTYNSTGYAYDVDVKSDTVYLADYAGGLVTLVDHYPAAFEVIRILGGMTILQVQRKGSLLVLGGDSGVAIHDATQPVTLPRAAFLPRIGDGVFGLHAVDGFLFETESSGFRIAALSELGYNWCGNGVLEPGEPCDDSNYVDGDGCTACCQEEPPEAVCGNGTVEYPETCDDGNLVAGDGCDPFCQREPSVCGNGVLEYGEECDDGNSNPADECDASCQVQSVCGNLVVEVGEECDDGNADPFDGCDACQQGPICGDGTVTSPEECDDGNRTPGDGCDATCQYEHTCGDGNLEPGEECDDGNTLPGDGCTPDCQIFECLITLPGDQNNSGSITSADIITLIGHVFKGGPPPLPCAAAGDINCSGTVTSADIITLIGFVFKGGAAPCDICNYSPLAATCN